MENVFIDTSVYEDGRFIASTSLKILFDAGRRGLIKIILPELTEYEILRHIDLKVPQSNGSKGLELLDKSYLKQNDEARKMLERLKELSVGLPAYFKDSFLEMCKRAKVERLALQDNIDAKAILSAYKECRPPFSEHKKEEFPDAFVLQSLEIWCRENKTKCIVLAKDDDMENYPSDVLIYKPLDEYKESLSKRIEEIETKDRIQHMIDMALLNTRIDSRIRDGIGVWIRNQLDNEILYTELLCIEDINHYSIDDSPTVEYERNWELIGTYQDEYILRVTANVETTIGVYHPDYDTAYHDSEDDVWYFMDEDKMTEVTCSISIPIEISVDENGNINQLESINGGKELIMSELRNSLSTEGEY